MNYSYINGSRVSDIVLGTDYYGSLIDEKMCFRLYDIFADCGGNHIDTAHLYVGGESEKMLGRWLKGKDRSSIYVATKGAHPPLNDMTASRLTKAEVGKDLDESLMRLGVDYIDLYWLHRDNKKADTGEVIEFLNDFIRAGKIKSIGCSNWTGKRIKEANDYACKHNLQGFSASQIKWSLAGTSRDYVDDPTLVEINETEYEYYRASGIPIVAFASQAKGFFSKLANGGVGSLSNKARERYMSEKNLMIFEKLTEIAEKHDTTVGAVALSFLTSLKSVKVMPIIGCKNEIQLNDSLKAAELKLTEEEIKYIFY